MKTCRPAGISASFAANMKSGGVTPSGMKAFLHFRMVALLAAGLMAACPRAGAQLGLSVTSSVSSILVSNSVTFTINLTNLTGSLLFDTIVTNTLPASASNLSVQVLYASANQVTYTTNGSVVRFDLYQFAYGGIAQLSVTAEPTATGFITNTVTVAAIGVTNTASSSVVVQVTNAVTPQANLGVTIRGPAQAVFTNDWMTYRVTATNSGPNAADSVALTNTLPVGVGLIGVSPTNQSYFPAGSNLIFNLGTLTNRGSTNLQFTVQPTNAGVLKFSASIGAPGVLDTNLANNTASTNITVANYLPGQLVAEISSPQTYNMQNNLVEQGVRLTNQGTNSVPAARVVVLGLAATNVLFNAVGTNNGKPFVVYGTRLDTNQSVGLLLQFAANNYFPFDNSQLPAFAVTPPNWTAPAAAASTNINIIQIVRLSSGSMLIWFPSVSNRTYTVVYSSNLSSTNWLMAQPSVVAPTTFTEWIDYGPPATLSHPTNASARFYRVFLNP